MAFISTQSDTSYGVLSGLTPFPEGCESSVASLSYLSVNVDIWTPQDLSNSAKCLYSSSWVDSTLTVEFQQMLRGKNNVSCGRWRWLEDFTELTHGFHGWVCLEMWSGRHLVRSFSQRVFAALWLKEGLLDRVPSSLAVGVVVGKRGFLSCFGNELENVRLFTCQLKCSVSWLSAKSVPWHSCLFFFLFPSVVSHCVSLCLGCLRMCELL